MPLIKNTRAPHFTIPGVEFISLAAPSRGSQENALWQAVIAPRTTGVVHHMTREEILLAVSGDGIVRIAGEAHRLTTGDTFAIPAFTDFQLESATDEPFEAIVVLPVGGRAVVAGEPSFAPPWSL
ncbi:MAG: cupin domain-containing protein [Devosia sp.]